MRASMWALSGVTQGFHDARQNDFLIKAISLNSHVRLQASFHRGIGLDQVFGARKWRDHSRENTRERAIPLDEPSQNRQDRRE